MGLETDCKTVVGNCSICVDVCENGEHTSGFGISTASVVIVNGEAGICASVLKRCGERRVNEREIRHKSAV